jgi:hypothetical protein
LHHQINNTMRFLTESDYITANSIDAKNVGEFAMFYVSYGKKYFITKLYLETLSVHEAWSIKMSEPNVIKVNEEFGREVLSKMGFGVVRGLVNKNGYQILCN